jgi:DNA-binding ferritin-like protein
MSDRPLSTPANVVGTKSTTSNTRRYYTRAQIIEKIKQRIQYLMRDVYNQKSEEKDNNNNNAMFDSDMQILNQRLYKDIERILERNVDRVVPPIERLFCAGADNTAKYLVDKFVEDCIHDITMENTRELQQLQSTTIDNTKATGHDDIVGGQNRGRTKTTVGEYLASIFENQQQQQQQEHRHHRKENDDGDREKINQSAETSQKMPQNISGMMNTSVMESDSINNIIDTDTDTIATSNIDSTKPSNNAFRVFFSNDNKYVDGNNGNSGDTIETATNIEEKKNKSTSDSDSWGVDTSLDTLKDLLNQAASELHKSADDDNNNDDDTRNSEEQEKQGSNASIDSDIEEGVEETKSGIQCNNKLLESDARGGSKNCDDNDGSNNNENM